jgi:hypothetical protein
MIVRESTMLEAFQWFGDRSHPRVSTCSCHPGMHSLIDSTGVGVWLDDGDWILTDPKTKDVKRVRNEAFQREYEVIAK